ncbi:MULTISPECIES: FAD-binding oxidoreductase [Spongiibacter]|uniref:FAD-binding oxidoreductase n=1 Tax=Spongiibacter TaxID=630749 RepID=UPI000C6AF761|nr:MULTISPECIES: FAD-binding oxidoreductase [Spongiibacter]MAY39215.1 FAD-binding oxidoreductase [Spongiibacter sp.]MBI57542.1 FAD-binding oxidoreductase [Spongiibacter sp.]|tara:strand:+ start:3129 stop:4541 length:1413 start_codon:yes stop_codon:yes gene_type:complete
MSSAPAHPHAERIITELKAIVGDDKVRLDADTLHSHGRDWTKAWEPAPMAVVFPRSTEQVQAIVQLANTEQLAVVPSGGRTGLSGGAVAANGELVVSFDYMNQISDFDPIDRTVRCQAGVITEQLQHYAEEQGLYYPVDFASAGSSQIGGNIATNAGGIKVLRWGMTRDWVAGLTVVTGSGEILHLNNGLLKNNAGYDLRQLFIGAEGTLGLICEATMQLTRQPKNLTAFVLGVENFDGIMSLFNRFQSEMDLTAFEFFSEQALQKVIEHSKLPRPFESTCPYYALLEFEKLNDETEEQAMALFEACVEEGWVLDGVMSQSLEQLKNLWRLREDISETISRWTPYKNDISTVISKVPNFLNAVEDVVNAEYPDFEIIWFGHIGDGNLHLNILKPDDLDKAVFFEQCGKVSLAVFDIVKRYGGSVSAEHGVGLLKKDYLQYSRSPEEIALMRQLKQIFDPKGLMNPGKIFD